MEKNIITSCFLILCIVFFVPSFASAAIPGIDGPIILCKGIDDCDFNALVTLAQNIITFLLYISTAVAAAAFAVAGFKYVTARGNPGQIESAHKIFTNVLVGLLIALAAWLVVNTILNGLLGAKKANFTILKQQS